MKLSELYEGGDFGINGIRKDALNKFLVQTIISTMATMSIPHPSNQWVLSLSKRLTGTLIPNLFHIRNVIGGREKYTEQKLMKYMAPYVKTAIDATAHDHPEVQDSEVMTDEYVVNFIKEIIKSKEQFKQTIN